MNLGWSASFLQPHWDAKISCGLGWALCLPYLWCEPQVQRAPAYPLLCSHNVPYPGEVSGPVSCSIPSQSSSPCFLNALQLQAVQQLQHEHWSTRSAHVAALFTCLPLLPTALGPISSMQTAWPPLQTPPSLGDQLRSYGGGLDQIQA